MGTPGHMAHPFDVDRVKTGQDLIDYIQDAVVRLQNNEIAGSVKWDGINTSFKLITNEDGQKEFRMDRGTSHIDSIEGFDAESALAKWGPTHGMANAIAKLLTIFNASIPAITPELKALKMWDDPTKYFNTEYIEGKSNVQEYDSNILAIHGINQFYEKKAQPHMIRKGISMDRPGLERPMDPRTRKPVKGTGIEIPYDHAALARLIEKVRPIAAKYGFEVYGDVPVEFDPDYDLDLEKVLETPVSVQITPGGVATNTLREWLQMVEHPQDTRVTRADGKSVGALSKDIYMAVLRSAEKNGIPLSEYLASKEDVKDAINGGIFYHGTRLLGQAVKEALRSMAGPVGSHEGVVLRGMEDFLVKLTGDFIVQGLASTHGDRSKQGLAEEEGGPVQAVRNVALYPGKFKPPHGGHFNVAKSVLSNPGVDKIIIFVSPKVHEGITPQQAVKIWNVYRQHLPGDVDVRVADVTPVRSVYEYIDNEADVGEDLHLILGEKDVEGGRFKSAEGRREGVNVQQVPIPPQMGGVSATMMRKALRDDDDVGFIRGLPTELNDSDVADIMRILGEQLDEMAANSAGAVTGFANTFPDVIGSEKRKKNKTSNNESVEDQFVNEVVDYLLGISVG